MGNFEPKRVIIIFALRIKSEFYIQNLQLLPEYSIKSCCFIINTNIYTNIHMGNSQFKNGIFELRTQRCYNSLCEYYIQN